MFIIVGLLWVFVGVKTKFSSISIRFLPFLLLLQSLVLQQVISMSSQELPYMMSLFILNIVFPIFIGVFFLQDLILQVIADVLGLYFIPNALKLDTKFGGSSFSYLSPETILFMAVLMLVRLAVIVVKELWLTLYLMKHVESTSSGVDIMEQALYHVESPIMVASLSNKLLYANGKGKKLINFQDVQVRIASRQDEPLLETTFNKNGGNSRS
jgi:hypothetical protein